MPDVAEGALIDGRYRVLHRLGAGGMADVFLVEDQQLGRKVALKLLHRRFAEDSAFVERFRREAQAAAGLQHPNVVSIYDRGRFDDTYYIAMEYLPGVSLKDLIRREAPMDPVRAIDIALQILAAARFAHRAGVIHRDLKPHNVIVDEAGLAKVTDFGIARAGASDMTETGSIMGTAQYLSPEQAQGRAVSPASDLYSVGVVMYEMLTGRVPFEGESPVSIALKHVSEAPVPPRRLNPAVPVELEQVVMWTLNKDPAHRPQDAGTLITALEQVRERLVAGISGGAGPLPPVARYVEREEVIAVAPAPERRRESWPWILALIVALIAGGAVAAYLLTRPKQVVVPAVTGEQLNLARTVLQNNGFSINVINVTSTRPGGTVIGQDPGGGSRAPKGSTVSLTVSQGPGVTTVPSVRGLKVRQAQALIARAGLSVTRVVEQSSTDIPRGYVISSDPAAGQTPQSGTGVTLFVSSGNPLVAVPDVTGQAEADAKAALERAGFTVTSQSQVSAGATPGTVISQSPAGGTQAPSGSGVTITLAKAPTSAAVPDVRGDSAGAARSALSAAGFQVQQRTRPVTAPNRDGIVVRQLPAPGTTLSKGSTVTIVVGKYTPASSTTSTSSTTSSTTSTSTTTTGP